MLVERHVAQSQHKVLPAKYDYCKLDTEAETLQQRAERKRGQDAISAYEQAAVRLLWQHLLPHMRSSVLLLPQISKFGMQNKFRQALSLEQSSPLPFERHCDAYFGLVGHYLSLLTDSAIDNGIANRL